MKTVEKLGDGEKTIEAVDRIDGGDVVFGVVFRRIMSYSSQIGGSSTIIHCVDFVCLGVSNELSQIGGSSTIIHCVDFVCLGVSNELANEQIIYSSLV